MSDSDQENYAQNRQRAAELDNRPARIRDLNDQFRQSLVGGYLVLTAGVKNLGLDVVRQIMGNIQRFDQFESANDPYGEHDFGALSWGSEKLFWKIDYYDKRLEYGSPDPADPTLTARVLTVMLSSEY